MQRSGSSPSRLDCSSLFCECPNFCDLAKQRRKIFWGVSEVGKNDFSLYFCWRCVVLLVLYYFSAAIARHSAKNDRQHRHKFPCIKLAAGEQTVKTLVEQWFERYGAPKEVHCDKDVRIRSDTGWYKRVLDALNVHVTTGVPYTQTSNLLCER